MKLIFALTGSIKGEECARRCQEGKEGGGRERESGFFPPLKLTKEFRFLYNRFNLIPALDRRVPARM